jgi:hypothetical protein
VLTAEELRALGDELVPRFGDPEIQARTFAPLILDCIVSAGVYEPHWVPPFERWYVAEEDLRGYDEKLGWLHAVAHGADLLGTLGQHAAVEPIQMLRLGIGRLLTPTSYVLRDMEDDRLGYALAATLTRDDLTESDAVDWLDPAIRALSNPPVEGITPEVTNTIRTLRVVYVLADHGLRVGDEKNSRRSRGVNRSRQSWPTCSGSSRRTISERVEVMPGCRQLPDGVRRIRLSSCFSLNPPRATACRVPGRSTGVVRWQWRARP